MLKPPSEKISAETREKLLALADYIETRPPHMFDMSLFLGHNECGTTYCIGGWVCVYAGVPLYCNSHTPFMFTQQFLGLTKEQAEALCYPMHPKPSHSDLTREDAGRVLRHLAYTGEVDWSV